MNLSAHHTSHTHLLTASVWQLEEAQGTSACEWMCLYRVPDRERAEWSLKMAGRDDDGEKTHVDSGA